MPYPDSNRPPIPKEVVEVTVDREREFRRLRVFHLDASGFRLGLAVFSIPKGRDGVLARLRNTLEVDRIQLRVLDVASAPIESTLLGLVRDDQKQLTLPDGWRVALHVVGLESRIAFHKSPGNGDDSGLGFFADANLHRELLADAWPSALILWLTESASLALGQAAGDLWHWRSASFDFTSERLPNGAGFRLLRDNETNPMASEGSINDIPWLERELAGIVALTDGDSPQRLAHRADLLLRLGANYRECDRLDESRRTLTTAKELAFRLDDELRQARACSELGLTLYQSGQFSEAEPLLQKALATTERLSGLYHPTTATILNNLAALLKYTHRLKGAETLYRLSLAIYEQLHGPQDLSVAIVLNNLADLFRITNRPFEAEQFYRRALVVTEQCRGPDHPFVAICLNNLAALLDETHQPNEAEPLYRRALSIDEKRYGKDHPSIAAVLNNLGVMLVKANRATEGSPLLERAAEILIRTMGIKHPDTRNVFDNARAAEALKQV